MGLDDREHMRERYRARTGGMKWNERVWGVKGIWFVPVRRGSDGQRARAPLTRASAGWPPRWLVFATGVLLGLAAVWYRTNQGWSLNREPMLVFPATGSVTVNGRLDPHSATSRMKVTAGKANAVVQLFTPGSDLHILSVYVRAGDSVSVPVPPGVFRMRLIEGRRWYGQADFFGPFTRFETVRDLQSFTEHQGGGIDLRRTLQGTMKTRTERRSPPPLNVERASHELHQDH